MKPSFFALTFIAALFAAPMAQAQVPAELQKQVDTAKLTLADLAKNPAVIAAVKDSNSKGGIVAGMSNSKWDELAETDPQVKSIDNNAISKTLQGFAAKNTALNKLYLRDEKGNLVGAGVGGKTILWNIGSRPFFKPVMEGKAWSDSTVKPDPTTQVKGVALIVPVMDGGKAIGSLQSNYTSK